MNPGCRPHRRNINTTRFCSQINWNFLIRLNYLSLKEKLTGKSILMFPKGPGRIQAPEGTENKLLKHQRVTICPNRWPAT